ncbi:MAG: ATP synthase F1 subunit gamma [Limnochordales bacterium]
MAGQSMRDIKRRITSVKNIQQITKAMELVSATKLRRAQQSVETARPYAEKLQEVLDRLIAAEGVGRGRRKVQHPLLQGRTVEKVCYVIMTGDRGLAGAYNANVLRLAEQTLAEETRPYEIITIGRKGNEYLQRRGYEVRRDLIGIGDDVHFHQARDLSKMLTEMYTSGEADEIKFVYTRFLSAGSQRPAVETLLPLRALAAGAEAGDEATAEAAEEAVVVAADAEEGIQYIYEPSPDEVLGLLLPRHVDMQVFAMLVEAKASEHAARMRAMRSASDNAGEMIRTLTLSFNRARQAAITKEIAEIVGGAEALQAGAGM